MENVYTILQRLHELRQKNPVDSEHFEAMGKLIAARDHRGIAEHILNKTKQGFFKSDYQKQLAKLLPHYKVSSAEDAEIRLKKLLAAIHMSRHDTVKLQEVLETGSAIVVNDIYRGEERYMFEYGMSPLILAIKEKNAAAIQLLIKYGANLDHVKDVNAALDKEGITILHAACFLKIPELTKMVLARGADPNIRDKHQQTPLYMASVYNDDANVLLLLKARADPSMSSEVNGRKYNPFFLAIQHKNLKLVKAMLKAGYKVKDKNLQHAKLVSDEIYKLLKNPLRFRKVQTMFATKHDAVPHKNEALHSIFTAMFTGDEKLKAGLKERVEEIYFHENNILKPLLDLVALATQSRHDAGVKKGKKFKIIISEEKHVDDLTAAGVYCHGIYKGNNAVYVAGFHGNARKSLATMLHEFKHFADKQVYGNTGKPYRETQQQHFMKVKEALRQAVLDFRQTREATADAIDRKMFKTIASIFEDYKPGDQDAEVLVKVPEIIGYLGVEKGVAWLEKNVKFLLKFYELRFNPACEKYLAERVSQENIETDTNKPKM